MARSHRRHSSILKRIKKTTSDTLPVLDKGLTTVGKTAKSVTKKSIPVIEKGVSAVYGTMATGLDLGVKGVKSVTRGVSRVSRSRKLSGGRRTRRHRKH
jgi:hypothetical protein